jgi:V/A-type H+-transporting ATPase subunit A
LQQDAFDSVDAVTPMERQHYMLDLILNICRKNFQFGDFVEVADFFRKAINICKQMNYSEFKEGQFENYRRELEALVNV